jgi:hypothetical protein
VLRTWIEGDHGSEVRLLTMPGMGHGVPDNVLDMIIPFLTAHAK